MAYSELVKRRCMTKRVSVTWVFLVPVCLFALLTEVVRHGIIKLLFSGCQLIGCGFRMSRLKQGLAVPIDHVLLQPSYEETIGAIGRIFLYAFFDHGIGGKDVRIEQLEQELEGVLPSAVWRCREEQHVLGFFGNGLDGLVALGLVLLGSVIELAQFVTLVHNDHVPGYALQCGHHIFCTDEIHRSHATVCLRKDVGFQT